MDYIRNYIWTTREGEEIKLKDLSLEHLFRLLVYTDLRGLLFKPFKDKHPSLNLYLREEIKFREAIAPFEKFSGFKLDCYPRLVEASREQKKLSRRRFLGTYEGDQYWLLYLTPEQRAIAQRLGEYLICINNR